MPYLLEMMIFLQEQCWLNTSSSRSTHKKTQSAPLPQQTRETRSTSHRAGTPKWARAPIPARSQTSTHRHHTTEVLLRPLTLLWNSAVNPILLMITSLFPYATMGLLLQAAGGQRLTKFAIKVEWLSCICSSEDAETWRTSPWNLSHGQIPAARALLLCSCSPAGPALRNCSLQASCTGCALLAGSPSRDTPSFTPTTTHPGLSVTSLSTV